MPFRVPHWELNLELKQHDDAELNLLNQRPLYIRCGQLANNECVKAFYGPLLFIVLLATGKAP